MWVTGWRGRTSINLEALQEGCPMTGGQADGRIVWDAAASRPDPAGSLMMKSLCYTSET